MPSPQHLRGGSRLAIDAVTGVTDLVEALHAEITRLPLTAPRQRTTGLTGLVYRSVRGVTRLVGGGLDLALDRLGPLLGEADPGRAVAALAALNGVLGDYLEATANPLATPMSLHPLVDGASGPPLVLLHGLCMNEAQWRRKTDGEGADFPAALAALGYRPLGLRYNSGRPSGAMAPSWPRCWTRCRGRSRCWATAWAGWSRAAPSRRRRAGAGPRGCSRWSRWARPTWARRWSAAASRCSSCWRSAPIHARWLGDGLVPVASALGRHREAARRLAPPPKTD